jgi:hypothetical protein
MAEYRVELTEDAKGDLFFYAASERKLVLGEIREGLWYDPLVNDFEKEAETLRNSASFQQFLKMRSRATGRISLEEIEAEVDRET